MKLDSRHHISQVAGHEVFRIHRLVRPHRAQSAGLFPFELHPCPVHFLQLMKGEGPRLYTEDAGPVPDDVPEVSGVSSFAICSTS